MSKKNVGINKTEKAVLGILISNPEKTAGEMAVEVGVTRRTIERTLVSLKNKGLIERIGSNKNLRKTRFEFGKGANTVIGENDSGKKQCNDSNANFAR
ncbi:helix-turn-helix domain-containing protein [Butyrivibrio sp. NC3005]|uniref:helix-turn-helix domain-containing protein n=1 Tax=Butyrivibrio sp. NC3005 TaxID=1280685 RepID=UPI000684533A